MTPPVTSRSTSRADAKPRHPLAHLPGEDGWPIVGNTFAALRDPVGHVETMYRKHGAVYRDHLFGTHAVVLLGPEANELVVRLVRLDVSHHFVQFVRHLQGQLGQALRRVHFH